ncbi:ABC transporter ATP-binding protein [Ferroglobus sp.]|uniref:ABC transporter ATP-binding protein n=1 Tax=Ferroglobus sp. TaxID=2614230 RepID=UPI0025B8A0BC|nr:ABC transporter ATP-binding protein [Ferroglobus sp.]
MVVVELKEVKFGYNSSDEILKGISFRANPGEITAIVGPNGAGKSTLLKIIAKILKPKSGIVLFDGKNLSKEETTKIVSYLPQENSIPGILTVFEAVLLGRLPHLSWRVKREDLEIVRNTITELRLEKYAERYTSQLSGGEKQMVLIAQALVREPKVLLLDEPVSNLDMRNQLEILELIKKFTKERKISTIVVLHDLNLAAKYADKIVIISNGKVRAYGDAKSVLRPEVLAEVYEVEVNISSSDGNIHILPLRPLSRSFCSEVC